MLLNILLLGSMSITVLMLFATALDPTKRTNIYDKIETIKQIQSENEVLVDGQLGRETQAVLLGYTEEDTTTVVEDSETHEIKQEKCPYCSGILDLVHNKNGICTCEYCGSQVYIW